MVLNQLDKLDALPPDRREEVRASLAEYNAITAPRKGLIMLEMRIMAPMTDQQRANYMSRPLFRRRFSEAEIRMMSDLHGIVP
jgi:hypothetical protein